MAIDLKAPAFPESVADGTIATWHKQPGEVVNRGDLIVDIETDNAKPVSTEFHHQGQTDIA